MRPKKLSRPGTILVYLAVIVPAALILSPGPVRAGGIVRDSIGAISSGRGGANLAHDDNLGIIQDNPAGLSWMDEDLRIEFSGDLLFPSVKYSDPDGSDRSREEVFFLPQFSVAGRKPGSPVTFGLSFFLPGGYGVDYVLNHSIFGPQPYESKGLLLKVLPSVSIRLGELLSVGGGVGFGYSETSLRLPYTFQTGPLALQSGLIHLDTDGFGVTGNFGIQIRPIDGLVIGAAFISETFIKQDGRFDLDVTGSPLAGLVTDPTAIYDVEHVMRWPRSLAAGASYTFEQGRISTDVAWFDWSSSFDDLSFKLSNGDNPEFDALVGTEPSDKFPLNWDDSFSVRLGYEHFVSESTTLRIGYIYNHNPVPDSTLTPILPGILQHSISVGFGHEYRSIEFNASYQYAFSRTQEVGVSSILGGDFDQSSVRAEAHWLFLSVAVKF